MIKSEMLDRHLNSNCYITGVKRVFEMKTGFRTKQYKGEHIDLSHSNLEKYMKRKGEKLDECPKRNLHVEDINMKKTHAWQRQRCKKNKRRSKTGTKGESF